MAEIPKTKKPVAKATTRPPAPTPDFSISQVTQPTALDLRQQKLTTMLHFLKQQVDLATEKALICKESGDIENAKFYLKLKKMWNLDIEQIQIALPNQTIRVPRAHTEEREFKVQIKNADVHQDILEFSITDLNNVSPPAGYDTLNIYAICELFYPTEDTKQKYQPSAVACSGPGFTTNGVPWKTYLKIDRKKQFLMFAKSKKIIVQLWHSRGLFFFDVEVGRVEVKLTTLFEKSTSTFTAEILDPVHKKQTGGSIGVKMRVQTPLGKQEIKTTKHKLLFIDHHYTLDDMVDGGLAEFDSHPAPVQRKVAAPQQPPQPKKPVQQQKAQPAPQQKPAQRPPTQAQPKPKPAQPKPKPIEELDPELIVMEDPDADLPDPDDVEMSSEEFDEEKELQKLAASVDTDMGEEQTDHSNEETPIETETSPKQETPPPSPKPKPKPQQAAPKPAQKPKGLPDTDSVTWSVSLKVLEFEIAELQKRSAAMKKAGQDPGPTVDALIMGKNIFMNGLIDKCQRQELSIDTYVLCVKNKIQDEANAKALFLSHGMAARASACDIRIKLMHTELKEFEEQQ